MALSLLQRLRIKEGMTLLTINAPGDFEASLEAAPGSIKVLAKANKFEQVHWFVKNKQQVAKEIDKVLPLVKGDILCWIYYPKATSGIQTDLSRDKGWEILENYKDIKWITLVSYNDTFSAFALRRESAAATVVEKPKANVREIFNYADAATKTVRLPDDLSAALTLSPAAAANFEKLSFTNKKEYVEWIVTAKRDVTRNERVTGTIERLEKGWKNPRNL